ncbi:MAG: DPP IV N-terminal domain-containing protein, partial [Gemmatimonadetes bacterium]|nr:DPP IV N-terminal domain-containing protein [Gemmatimonadota bacterium]
MTRPRPIPLASILPLALAAPLAALALSANPATAQQRLSLDHYMDMETVSNPQISPDGGRIVYTKGWIDERNDRRESALWMMNADGTRQRHLVDGGGGMWSPDGTRILYTAAGDPGGSQLHVRWMDAEGLSTPVTRLENGPSNPRWSPDGNWIAFTSRVSDRADFAGVDLPARPDGAQWEREPKVVERPAYKRDGVGYIDTGWTHVFVVPAGGGTPRQLTDGDWNHSSIEWSPDGTEIYFTSFRHEDADRPEHWQESEIYAVSVASGEIRQLTDRHGPDGSPVASPDGSLI